MRSFILALFLSAALAGCGQQMSAAPSVESEVAVATAPPMIADMERAAEPSQSSGGQSPPASGANGGPAGASPVLYLAYNYALALELPGEQVPTVMDGHVQTCLSAGPRLCQLVNTSRYGDPESSIQGNLTLRGEPAWLRGFMGGLEAQTDAAGGRIVSETTTTEDLTRQIVDTEARQRALIALRERLEGLLRSRPGRLADLLEVERELARVQGELDAIQSSLAVMRTRVAMSELTLTYQSAPRSVGSDTFRPLSEAFANFLRIVVVSFAAIVTIIAGLLPFAIIIIPIVWGVLRWRRNRRAASQAESPPQHAGTAS